MSRWLGAWVLALAPSAAFGGEAFDEDIVRFAPVAPVAGGETTRIHVLALDAEGNPRTGLGATAIGAGGRAGDLQEVGNGWYMVSFTADRDASAGSVRLRGALSGKVTVPLLPARPSRFTVTADPPAVVVATGAPSRMTFTLPGFPPPLDLVTRASSGGAGPATKEGDSSWLVTLTAPSTNYPHLGIVTGAIPGGVAVGGGAVAFVGAVAFPIQGPPGARVTMKVGGKSFGPVTIDATGNARLPIEVPPGVREAVQIIEQGNQRTEGRIDLGPPGTRRLAWVPAPGPIPVGKSATLHLLVLEAHGSPDMDAQVDVQTTVGTVGRAAHIGNGLYAVDYTPGAAAQGTLTARIPGSPVDVDSLDVSHLAAMPAVGLPPTSGGAVAAVLLLAPDPVVSPTASSTIRAVAVDRYGYPVPGVTLALSATVGNVPSSVNTGGTGVAELAWSGNGMRGSLVVEATTTTGVSGTASMLSTDRAIQVREPEWTGMLAEWRDRLAAPAPAPVPVPEPVAPVPEPVAPVPEPGPGPVASSGELPMIRARLGAAFGTYTYAQVPNADPGPLLPGRFSLGGAEGAKPASLQGVEADARAWFLPWVGAHVAGRVTQYSFDTNVFARPISDVISHLRVDATGRVPFELDDAADHPTTVWAGVSAGFQLDDFLVFKGCLEPGCEVAYETIFVPAMEIGGEIGFEAGPVFGIASVHQGLAGARVPYRVGFDVDAGYELSDRVFLSVGGAGVVRQIAIEGRDSGTEYGGIVDRQWFGRAAVGIQL
ncbi:MAG: Ig-like domain-containing protein [Alphaproteobacteria bacterium]|nr:Ig-like domain-containing protein [Alphaproteobacteria bacterium]